MSKKLLSTLIASLFAAAPALAQSDDPIRIEGSATIGGIYNNTSADDLAKLQEYQDLGNGALSSISARGRNSTNWFQGYGENFGRSDQYMFLRGGMYDVFKAGAYLNDIPHNFSTNAVTPLNGVGGGLLTTSFPQINSANWNSFTLGYDRRDAGGYFEWSKNSPWYFRVDGNQVQFSGTKVGSGANGTSPTYGFTDLAFPNNNETSNWGVEGGYQTSKATFALRWDYSKFDNAIEQLNWTNPYFGGNNLDTTWLAPDNEFNKFTATGNYRGLPWNSVIAARYTWAETKSNVNLGQTALNGPPAAYNATLPDENTFNGKNVNQSFALSWTANPTSTLDSRFYYYWTKLESESDIVEYGNAPAQPLATGLGCGNIAPVTGNPLTTPWLVGNCENELYNYTKNNVGFDVWWRFAKGQKLGFGYDYLNLDQTRIDYDKSHTNKVFVEYKNTMLETLTGRLKWQWLKRDSTSNFSNEGVSPNDPNYLLPYTSAFDLQSSTTNGIKLNLDWVPMANLNMSFEGNWAKQNYDSVTYGRADNRLQGYYLSVNWGTPGGVMLSGFGDWQEVKTPSQHRYIGTISGGPSSSTGSTPTPPPGWCTAANPNCFVPTAAPTSGSYNWNSEVKDQSWMLGLGMDWPVSKAWMFKASYIYVNNSGSASFASQNSTGAMVDAPNGYGNPLNIGNFDDSTQQYLNLKAIYSYGKNWTFVAGYAWEKWSRNDIAYDGYQNFAPYPPVATNTSLSYLNNYNAFLNGNQNIFYATVTYKFDAPSLPSAPEKKVAEAPKPAAPPPPPPPPPPAPAKPAPMVQKITLDSKVLFDFDKAVLKPEGKAALDSQVVGKLNTIQKLEVVLVTGHTDPIGTEQYNQKLSERRADAVRDYLVSKGVPKDRIEAIGMGEKQPVIGEKECNQKNLKDKIACLQPDRRVEVQAKGEATK